MKDKTEHTDGDEQDGAAVAAVEITLPHEIALAYPVQHGNETVDKLVFTRRPVAGDMRGIKLRDLDLGDHVITLTARLVSQPPSVVAKLDVLDLMECGDVIQRFFAPGPKTGKAPAA